jgi:hypothetical protein
MAVHCNKILKDTVGKFHYFLERWVLKGHSHRLCTKRIYELVYLRSDLLCHGDRGHLRSDGVP